MHLCPIKQRYVLAQQCYTTGNRRAYNALGKGFVECHTRQRLSQKPTRQKKVSAKAALLSAFYRALGKPDTQKSSKWKKSLQKNFFFTREAPIGQRPPVSVEVASRGIFRVKFAHYATGGIRTRDLSLARNPLYHCTILSLVSRFRFDSPYTILIRV
jgi:hypothetical protein